MNIKVHIERLIVDEAIMASGEPRQLQAAVRAELMRLATAGGVSTELAGGGALPSVTAKAIQFSDPGPFSLGRQIADSIYSGIGGSGRGEINDRRSRKAR
jgi:hypothetical protein